MNTTSTKDTINRGNAEHMIDQAAPELQRGPQWLREHRHASRDFFNDSPIPPRGLHLWRYTDPSRFLVAQTDRIDTPFGEGYDEVETVLLDELAGDGLAAVVIDRGGRQIRCHTSEALTQSKVIVSSLSDAVLYHSDLVEKHLYRLVNAKSGKFEALNGALWNDGIFVHIPDGTTIEKPIHLLRQAGAANSAQFPRLLISVGDNAEATIIDEYGGGPDSPTGEAGHSNAVVEIVAAADSRTNYVCLQRQGVGTLSYLTYRAQVGPGARILTVPLSFGGAIAKHNFGVILNGRHSESQIYGLAFGSGYQHFDNHTLHHHAANETSSKIDYKVVLKDKAQSACTGLIRIEQDAKTCEAYQENRNLLLNKGTKAQAIPELEILNEDVHCSHGATIGPIDPLQLFYLESHGIEKSRAQRMVVTGFVETTMKRLPTELRERIREFVLQRLEQQ
ncbi:MAG: Fe-S cluster assembly protein SufD [bacterium]